MSSYGGRRPLGCIHNNMLPGPRTSVSFPFVSFAVLGIWGENFVFELFVLERHMADLGGVCVWNKEAAKKKSRKKYVDLGVKGTFKQ